MAALRLRVVRNLQRVNKNNCTVWPNLMIFPKLSRNVETSRCLLVLRFVPNKPIFALESRPVVKPSESRQFWAPRFRGSVLPIFWTSILKSGPLTNTWPSSIEFRLETFEGTFVRKNNSETWLLRSIASCN